MGANSVRLEFKEGEQVRAICNHAYRIKEGKIYTIIKFEPEFYDRTSPSGFTWPSYATVIGDNGKPITCHAHRFAKLEANQC
jgi:hypothetical protein